MSNHPDETAERQAPGQAPAGRGEDSTQPSLASLDQTVAQLQDQLEALEEHVNNLRVACFAVASQTTYLVRAFLESSGMQQQQAGQPTAVASLTAPRTSSRTTVTVGTVVAGSTPGRALPPDILQQMRASLAAMNDLEQAMRSRVQRTASVGAPPSPSSGHMTRH